MLKLYKVKKKILSPIKNIFLNTILLFREIQNQDIKRKKNLKMWTIKLML